MFSISKIVTFLFLPPGFFLLILLASILLLLLATKRSGGGLGGDPAAGTEDSTKNLTGEKCRRLLRLVIRLLALHSIALYLLSSEPVSELLLRPLERAHPPLVLGGSDAGGRVDTVESESIEAEAIVVLGGGTISSSPEEGGNAAPAVETLKRLSFAYRIHRLTGTPIITTGGTPQAARDNRTTQQGPMQPPAPNYQHAPLQPRVSAGAAMGRYLISLGAAPGSVHTEEASRNTFENAALVAEKYQPEKVILVTSAYHIPRSVWVFEQIGMEVLPAPTDYKIDGDGYNIWSFFPTMGELHDSYKALHEYVGIVYYLLRFRNEG